MKKHYLLYLCLLMLILTACVNRAEDVMPSVAYKQPVDVHISKTAYLYWQPGEQHASIAPTYVPYNAGLVGGLIASAIDSQSRKTNPAKYTYTYGKAQQAVFMTSLKDILENNSVFNKVILTTDLSSVKPQDVLIKIYFKSTRVGSFEKDYPVTLDTEMTIQTNNKPTFKRTYLVQSEESGYFSSKTFKEQQTDASQQLLTKLINGIKQWNTQS